MPAIPPIPLLEQTGFDTNETIFKRRTLPGHLAVIGGGPIGVELAQAFSRLGSQVTIIEAADRLLAQGDRQASLLLQEALEAEGIAIITAAQVAGVRREADARQITLADGRTIECERILVATGRRPVVHGLGLEEAGVEFGKQGIHVDRRLRTSQKHIYAVGDVCGPYPFTHMAEYQAGIVLANIVFRTPKKTDYRVVPRVVYTDPEVASVGLTESEAKSKGIKYHIAEFPMAELDRAITDDVDFGGARLLISKGRIAGASLVGPHAGELIHELGTGHAGQCESEGYRGNDTCLSKLCTDSSPHNQQKLRTLVAIEEGPFSCLDAESIAAVDVFTRVHTNACNPAIND